MALGDAPIWLSISALKEPFNDAFNYRSRDQKDFFNKIFLRTEELKACLGQSAFYLLGEKGTGKTAYAVFLENNSIDNWKCKVSTMTETQYKRFIELKRQGQLSYSDYANIWRSMLLLVVSQMLVEKSKTLLHSVTGKFKGVEKAVAAWNASALNPEIESAFEALRTEELRAAIETDGASAGAKSQTTNKIQTKGIAHNLLRTETGLKAAVEDLKLSSHHALFIDGIDYRPTSVPYSEYLDCVKGLAEDWMKA